MDSVACAALKHGDLPLADIAWQHMMNETSQKEQMTKALGCSENVTILNLQVYLLAFASQINIDLYQWNNSVIRN